MPQRQAGGGAPMINHNLEEVYGVIKEELAETGYVGSLIQEDYEFADILADEYSVGRIPLAAFAQDPPSYRNACLGVVTSNGLAGPRLVSKSRSLGAPQILEVHRSYLRRWKMTASGAPQLLEQISPEHVRPLFRRNRNEWSPARILKAKSLGDGDAAQLDFFDLGLLPLLEQEARNKLHRLLYETVSSSIREYEKYSVFADRDYPPLFRLLFRLIAAKVLADRGHPGEWINDDPRLTIEAVQDFYFGAAIPEAVLDHQQTQLVAWESIKHAFHFQNLSVDSLAYVYENTLVAKDTRRLFGIHSTPPGIAEYITRKLPFEDLDVGERRVFEPFAGHAVFLVAAMQRLRELLPTDMTASERHGYFVEMLAGIEIDDFAREVARLSLMLADYPNPDGWRLHRDNAFTSRHFDQELSNARVVLCNPPFEDFGLDERHSYPEIPSIRKPATVLHKVLQSPPDLLGFVLPIAFLSGQGYKDIRCQIGQTYSSIEVMALPDKVFSHSDAEAVLLLASKTNAATNKLHTGVVVANDLEDFYVTNEPSRRSESSFEASPVVFRESIWLPELQNVWAQTGNMTQLGDIAEIHRGIEYNVPFKPNESLLISERSLPGFSIGVPKIRNFVEPFLIRNSVYLNVSEDRMRGNAYRLPWDQPKIILNSARRSRGAWCIAASIDYEGVVCYQNFHGLWLKNDISLETMAAFLNGPVANAFVAARGRGRHVQVQLLRQIPVPNLNSAQDRAVAMAVQQYLQIRNEHLNGTIPDDEAKVIYPELIAQIDAETLKAYDLPPRVERSLLDYFTDQLRPGPADFERYFPSDFTPHLPWHRYISEEMNTASAKSTLSRLPVIDDLLVSNVVRNL